MHSDDMLLATAGGYARADDNEQINGVDNSVRLWDMRTLRPVSELVDHTEHEPRNQVRPERFFCFCFGTCSGISDSGKLGCLNRLKIKPSSESS